MKTLHSARTGNDRSHKSDYHIVEQAGRFKVYDQAGRFRLTFATREAAQAYIDGKHAIDGHTAFQVAASILVALFLLCYPLVANAGTVRCRLPWQPVLMRTANGGVTWTCMYIPNWEVRP